MSNICIVSRSNYDHLKKNGHRFTCLSDSNIIYIFSLRSKFDAPKGTYEELHLVELRDSEDYIPELIKAISTRKKIKYIISMSEQDLLPCAAARDKLHLDGLSYKDAIKFRDKFIMKQIAESVDVKVPNYSLLSNKDVSLRLLNDHGKIILKPRDGYGSQGVVVINNKDEFDYYSTKLNLCSNDYLIEEFIEYDVYHLDVLLRDGKIIFSSLGKYDSPLIDINEKEWSCSFISNKKSSIHLDALRIFKNLISGFGVNDGVFHFEFFSNGKEIYFCEIAIRPAGGGITDTIDQTWDINLNEEHVKLQMHTASSFGPENEFPVCYSAEMLMMSPKGGRIKEITGIKEINTEEFKKIKIDKAKGDVIEPSRHSGDSVLTIILSSESEDGLKRAMKMVKETVRIEFED